jgi:uncharacterized protein (TIRG00374 family)
MIVMPFPDFIKNSFYISGIFFGAVLVALFLISKNETKAVSIISKIPMPAKLKEIAVKFFDKFADGLIILRKPKVFCATFILSVLVWVTESVFLVLTASSCGIDISIIGGIFVVIIIGIGAIIPTAPGYIGAFEFMGVTALSALSVDKDAAFACIAIYHFLQLMTIFTLGILSVVKAKISFSDLFKFAKIEEQE